MSFIEIIFIALGLAADAFAVSVAIGSSGIAPDKRSSIRLSFHLGLFQFLMPIIGWFLGSKISFYIMSFDHWVAFIILSYIGGKMIFESLKNDEERIIKNFTKGMSMVMVSIATSIDALATGLSLAFLSITIFYPALIIGIITFALSFIGYRGGKKLKDKLGNKIELLGGIILCFVGLKILIEHLLR
ncbi:MAG TPA: manganese efflux pump MntP family protein [Melioribacteraceae bacterium]|nr:manganese efflux pump MntP family protein [Melioribacteraceae bacterium]